MASPLRDMAFPSIRIPCRIVAAAEAPPTGRSFTGGG